MLHQLNYKECYYAYKNMVTQFNISQEKKWSWHMALVTFHPEKKHANRITPQHTQHIPYTEQIKCRQRSCGERSHPQQHVQIDLKWLAR